VKWRRIIFLLLSGCHNPGGANTEQKKNDPAPFHGEILAASSDRRMPNFR